MITPSGANHSACLLYWMRGLQDEVAFWDRWFRTKGAAWPEDYAVRLKKDRPLPEYVAAVAPTTKGDRLRILDVGSGPLTVLGTQYDGGETQLVAVDPLADAYAALIRRSGVEPAVWPAVAFAEDLSAFYPSDSFDIVHSRNALDHSIDPVRGLWEIVEVLRIGGKAILLHSPNESEHQDGEGLHQWNFDLQAGRFVIWNKDGRVDVHDLLAEYCTVTAERLGPSVLAVIVKERALGLANLKYKNDRLRDLLRALSAASIQISRERVGVGQQLRRFHLPRIARVLAERLELASARWFGPRRPAENRRPCG